MSVKVFQIQKRSSYEYGFIQDKFAINNTEKSFAISDGTTQSFRSADWAQDLCHDFVNSPSFDAEALISRFTDCAKILDEREYQINDNPALAALEKEKLRRGATATFLGISLVGLELNAVGVGDGNIFILRNEALISWPFSSVDELDKNDFFLNSRSLIDGKVTSNYFQFNELELSETDIILVATDALSRLILRDKKIAKDLSLLTDFESFLKFCTKNWENRTLEEDDITLLVFQNFSSIHQEIATPPERFAFPKEEEIAFEPTIQGINTETTLNAEIMEKLLISSQRQTAEIVLLKSELKKQRTLIIVLILICFLNLSGMLFFRNTESTPYTPELESNKTNADKKLTRPDQKKEKTATKVIIPLDSASSSKLKDSSNKEQNPEGQ